MSKSNCQKKIERNTYFTWMLKGKRKWKKECRKTKLLKVHFKKQKSLVGRKERERKSVGSQERPSYRI